MRDAGRRVAAVVAAAAPAVLVAGGAVPAATGIGGLAWLRARGASLSASALGGAALAVAAPRMAGAAHDGVLAAACVGAWLFALGARGAHRVAGTAVLVGIGTWLGDLVVVGALAAWTAVTAPSTGARTATLLGTALGAALGAPRLLPELRGLLDSGLGSAPLLAHEASTTAIFAVGLVPIGLSLATAVLLLAAVAWLPAVRPPRMLDLLGFTGSLATALALDARATVGVALFGSAIACDRLDAMRRARGDGGRPPGLASRLAAAIALAAVVGAAGVVVTAVHDDPRATFRTLAGDGAVRDAWRVIAVGAAAACGLAVAVGLFLRGWLRAPWVAAAALALVAVDATLTPAHAEPAVRPTEPHAAPDSSHRPFGLWCAGAAVVALGSLALGAKRR